MKHFFRFNRIGYMLVLAFLILTSSHALQAQESDIVEKLGLESFEFKFGVSRGVAQEYSTFRDGERLLFSRISDSTQLRTFQMVNFEDRRLFSRMSGTFMEISRSFKPIKNDIQLNIGIRHSRNLMEYIGESRVNEVYSEVSDTLFVAPPSTDPSPLIVDGLECDTLIPQFGDFSRDPRMLLGSLALTTQLTKPFFDRKLFVSGGADFMFSYSRSHTVASNELFSFSTPDGVRCSYRGNAVMLDELPIPKVVVHGGVQFFPHPRFGIELQVRKHLLNIFPEGSSFAHRPMSFQLGWIVRLQDDFMAGKKLARQQRKMEKSNR